MGTCLSAEAAPPAKAAPATADAGKDGPVPAVPVRPPPAEATHREASDAKVHGTAARAADEPEEEAHTLPGVAPAGGKVPPASATSAGGAGASSADSAQSMRIFMPSSFLASNISQGVCAAYFFRR